MNTFKSNKIKRASKVKRAWMKAKRMIGGAMIVSAMSANPACHGNTDLSHDACKDNEVKMIIKVSVDGREAMVQNKNMLNINGKHYSVEVINDGNLLFSSADGSENIVVKRNGSARINEAEVRDLDRKVDMTAYSSRVLIKLQSGDSSQNIILGEHDSSSAYINDIVVYVSVGNIASWDNDGVVANVKLSSNSSDAVRVSLRAGYENMVEVGRRIISVELRDFAIDLFPINDAGLCDVNITPVSKLTINNEDVVLKEGFTYADGPISITLNKIFPGNSPETVMAEFKLETSAISLLRTISKNDALVLEDNGRVFFVYLNEVGFSE